MLARTINEKDDWNTLPCAPFLNLFPTSMRGNLYDQNTRDRGETLVFSTVEELNDRIPNRVLAFDSVTNQPPLRSAPVTTTLLVLQFLHIRIVETFVYRHPLTSNWADQQSICWFIHTSTRKHDRRTCFSVAFCKCYVHSSTVSTELRQISRWQGC